MNKIIKTMIIATAMFTHQLSPAAKNYSHLYEPLSDNPTSFGNLCYNIQTTYGRVINPTRFIIYSHLREDIRVYVGCLGVIEGSIIGYKREEALKIYPEQEISLDLLGKHNLLCVVFANAEACEKNSAEIKDLISKYNPVFSKYPGEYARMAKLALKKTSNIGDITQRLNALIASFKTSAYFPSVFFYSYIVNANESARLIFSQNPSNDPEYTQLETYKNSFIFKVIKNLVQIAIRAKLGICQHNDNFSSYKNAQDALKFQATSATKFAEAVGNQLTDNHIIAITICETEELLNAIQKVAC